MTPVTMSGVPVHRHRVTPKDSYGYYAFDSDYLVPTLIKMQNPAAVWYDPVTQTVHTSWAGYPGPMPVYGSGA